VLPLVAPGGSAILWTGAQVDDEALAATAALVGGAVEAGHDAAPGRRLVVLRKVEATPERFPRRPGIARARPLVPST
jgi:16S rRNA (guanine527-N7)-methyltransferase